MNAANDGGELVLRVAEQRAAEPGDERRQPERQQLVLRDVDADRPAARSLERTAMNIRPAGALRSRATSSPTQDHHDQHQDAEDHARVVVAAWRSRGPGRTASATGSAPGGAAGEALLVEEQRVDRERREAERHHREVDAAQAQRRQADQQAERHGAQAGQDQREREADAPIRARCARA